MRNSLNVSLTSELRRFVDERASDHDVYSTPSEYVRDLIRRDMEARNKAWENEIATMLVHARNSPQTPLEDDFIEKEIKLLKKHSAAKRRG